MSEWKLIEIDARKGIEAYYLLRLKPDGSIGLDGSWGNVQGIVEARILNDRIFGSAPSMMLRLTTIPEIDTTEIEAGIKDDSVDLCAALVRGDFDKVQRICDAHFEEGQENGCKEGD